jgi:hypothetical protein
VTGATALLVAMHASSCEPNVMNSASSPFHLVHEAVEVGGPVEIAFVRRCDDADERWVIEHAHEESRRPPVMHQVLG